MGIKGFVCVCVFIYRLRFHFAFWRPPKGKSTLQHLVIRQERQKNWEAGAKHSKLLFFIVKIRKIASAKWFELSGFFPPWNHFDRPDERTSEKDCLWWLQRLKLSHYKVFLRTRFTGMIRFHRGMIKTDNLRHKATAWSKCRIRWKALVEIDWNPAYTQSLDVGHTQLVTTAPSWLPKMCSAQYSLMVILPAWPIVVFFFFRHF